MKKMLNTKSILSLLVILVLIAALALTFTACEEDPNPGDEPHTEAPTIESNNGSGETEQKPSFFFTVVKSDGTTKSYTVQTNKDNVGDALVAEGLISGEEGAYGWFVTTVDGEFHKWEEDGKYWAFYIDGEYAMTGVSSTPITAGATYSFKVE